MTRFATQLPKPPSSSSHREPATLRRQPAGEHASTTVPPVVSETLRSTGQPLDAATRSFMEPRFGHDFSQVKVHTDARASASAKAVHARAYTVGHDIVFTVGSYAPSTAEGRQLLAHELTHTLDQRPASRPGLQAKLEIGEPGDAYERQADRIAQQVTRTPGGPDSAPAHHPPTERMHTPAAPRLMRQPRTGGGGKASDPPATTPLSIPAEGVDMPWVGKAAPSSEQGYLRNRQYFWARFQRAYSERLSVWNQQQIAADRSPVVDLTWISYYPEHGPYLGETLEHHHVGQGSRAVPLPETLHDASTVFHPQRRVVGTPTGGTRPLPPQPTRVYTEREINRHFEAGRFPGQESPPSAPEVPLSSEVAAIPPSQRRPVGPPSRPLRSTPGTKQTVRGVAVGVAQGLLAQTALSRDVATRRAESGYAAVSEDYTARESRIVKLYRRLTGAEGEAGLDERFDIAIFRENLRARADRAHPGEELAVLMPVRRKKVHREGIYSNAVYREVRVVFLKYRPHPRDPRSEQWLDVRVENWPEDAVIPYVPDLDRIVDPARSDKEVLDYLGLEYAGIEA